MARFITTVTTEGTPISPAVPIVGALVYVMTPGGSLETLTTDSGSYLPQPLLTGAGGALTFNVPDPGNVYTIQYRYGGRLIREDEEVIGNPPQFKGDPGGNVMSVSLATGVPSLAVGTGTNLIATTGNRAVRKGEWLYGADNDTTAASATVLVDAANRAFRMSRFAPPSAVVTGAIGISDITAANLVDESAYLNSLSGAMQADCATLPGKSGGGVQRLDPTLPIYINQPVTLKWVRLVGEYRRGEILGHNAQGNNPDKSTISLGSQASTIVCGPNGKITLGDGAYLENVCIVSLDAARFISPAGGSTEAQVNALLATYANYPVAIDTTNGASDCGVINCLIAGFQLGAKFVYNERYRFEGNKVDCINGFYQSQTYDYHWNNDNEYYPFVWSHRFASGGAECLKAYGEYVKYAVGNDSTRSTDGGWCCNNGCYGGLVGFDFESPNGLLVQGNWADNDVSRSDVNNTIGFRTSGNCRRSKLIANHADSHGRGFDIQGSGTMPDMNTTAGCTVSHMRYGLGADIVGGLHFFQGPSPLYIEVVEGCGKVTWGQTSISDWNGPLIALLGGGLPSAATRALIDLGKVTRTRTGTGASYDPRQWHSYVEVDNSASAQSFASGDTRVTLATKTNAGSPIDGYGEWSGSTWIAKYDGTYMFASNADGATSGAGVVSGQLRLVGVAQEISQDSRQLTAAGQATVGKATPLFVSAGQGVEFWISTNVGFNVPAGKATMTVTRIGN